MINEPWSSKSEKSIISSILLSFLALSFAGCDFSANGVGQTEAQGVAQLEQICRNFDFIPQTQIENARHLRNRLAQQRIADFNESGMPRLTIRERSPAELPFSGYSEQIAYPDRYIVYQHSVYLDGVFQHNLNLPVFRFPSSEGFMAEGFVEHECGPPFNASLNTLIRQGSFIRE